MPAGPRCARCFSARVHDLPSDTPLYISGRFFTQPLSGVQRFATEITAALQRAYPGRMVVLGPAGSDRTEASAHIVGRRGEGWEQFESPAHAAGGMLINLGNTAPLRLRRQIVVIHYAGVFATPEAYSRKFRLWYKLPKGFWCAVGCAL